MEENKITLLNSFVKSIKSESPQSFFNVTIFPLFSEEISEGRYILLEDALKTGKFSIKEVSEAGSVPELRVINMLDNDVLLIEGDILKGAKQHRTINTTIIVGKYREILIPVSCVERGRWSYTSDEFESSLFFSDIDVRSIKTRSVSNSLRRRRGYHSDQGRVWHEIHKKMGVFNSYSGTESAEEIYYSKIDEFEEYLKNYKLLDRQTGLAVFIDNELSGIEIFGVKGILEKVYKKVLGSYIYKAIENKYRLKSSYIDDISKLEQELLNAFKRVSGLNKEIFKSIGEGFDIRFDEQEITGFALEHDNKIVHFASFFNENRL